MRKRKQSSGAPETVLAGPGKSGGDLRDSELLSEGSQFEQGWNDSCETQAANHSFSGSKFLSGISLEHLGLLNNFLAGLRYLEESSAPKEQSRPTFALPLTRENADVLVDAFLAKLWRRVPLKPRPGSKGEQCPFSGLNRNQLYELFNRLDGNDQPLVKNCSLAEEDENSGARFYSIGSALNYLEARSQRPPAAKT